MDILFLLIPLSVVLVFLIGVAFWWSLRHGQFDDLEGPGYRILMDDDRPERNGSTAQAEQADRVQAASQRLPAKTKTEGKAS